MQKNSGAVRFIALSGFSLAVAFAAAAMGSGFGTRFGLWDFRPGLSILRFAAYGEAGAFLLSLAGFISLIKKGPGRPLALALAGVVCSLIVLAVTFNWWQIAKRVPPIHDITTDTENPPGFVAVLELRKDSPNPARYGGPEIAEQQRRAYPDIIPLVLEVRSDQAFELALRSAKSMGWEIVNADKKAGIIEATDTTFWFGFKDDIIIRITPDGNRSRVDVRSVSRVGRSDVGANAKRISNYLEKLKR